MTALTTGNVAESNFSRVSREGAEGGEEGEGGVRVTLAVETWMGERRRARWTHYWEITAAAEDQGDRRPKQKPTANTGGGRHPPTHH